MESNISGTRSDLTSSKDLKVCFSGDFINAPEQGERRQNQYLADVAQETADRQRRSVEVLDPTNGMLHK